MGKNWLDINDVDVLFNAPAGLCNATSLFYFAWVFKFFFTFCSTILSGVIFAMLLASFLTMGRACAHYVMVSKFQWKPSWLATQREFLFALVLLCRSTRLSPVVSRNARILFLFFLSYLSITFHPLWAFPLKFMLMTLPCIMSTATPFLFNISSSTGGDRLHRRVGWILAWQIWSCKDEDLVDQQRYPAWSPHSDNGRTCSYSNRQSSTCWSCVIRGPQMVKACTVHYGSSIKESRPAPSDGTRPSSPSGIKTLCVLCSSCAGICQPCVARLSPGRGRNVLGTDTGQCYALSSPSWLVYTKRGTFPTARLAST